MLKEPPTGRRIGVLEVGVIVSIALLLRVAWIAFRWRQSGAGLEFDDEALHWQLATNLVTHGSLVSDDGRCVARMPLYPAFLALFAWTGPFGVLAARLAQALLSAATAWIAARLAGETWGRRAAWTGGLLVALDPYSIFFSNLLLTEVSFAFVAVALVACAAKFIPSQPRASVARTTVASGFLVRDWLLAGLCAAAIFIRPSAAGWIALLWVGLWLSDRDRWRAAARNLLGAAVLAALLIPWGLRNMAALGDFAWLSANGGVTLYDAQGPQADGSSNQAFLREMPYLSAFGEVESDRLLGRWALLEMKRDKLGVLTLAWTKLLRTWNPVPNFAGYRELTIGAVSAAFTITVVALALVGTFRNRDRLVTVIWVPVIYFTLLHCVYIGSLRYRVPLMPLLSIAAAGALAGRAPVENRREVIIPTAE